MAELDDERGTRRRYDDAVYRAAREGECLFDARRRRHHVHLDRRPSGEGLNPSRLPEVNDADECARRGREEDLEAVIEPGQTGLFATFVTIVRRPVDLGSVKNSSVGRGRPPSAQGSENCGASRSAKSSGASGLSSELVVEDG